MKKLVIAEKPSLARAIMKSLSSTGEKFISKKNNEYNESANFVVTSVFGHILELGDFEIYPENKGKDMWDEKNLPFFPRKYKYVVKKDTKDRYNTIKRLLTRTDVDEVVHCGDPDREGQVLVDIVLKSLGCKKPVTRPFLKTLTEDAILQAFKERKPNEEYRNWLNEGLARSYVDFDYGINLSRYTNSKTNAYPALNVGRVIGAIVTEIYEREKDIANFKPKIFFKVVSTKSGIKLISKKNFDTKKEADEYAKKAGNLATVKSIESKNTVKQPPKLFSLTSLQAVCNERFGYSETETLKLAQSLYEKQLTSYPRSNTEYMNDDEKENVKKIIDAHNGKGELTFHNSKRVFDSSKTEGHSAIIPTVKKASGLDEKSQNCYDTILNRFKAMFTAEKAVFKNTDMEITVPGFEDFKIHGSVLKQKGWIRFEPKALKEKTLPDLNEGDSFPIEFKSQEAQTSPPKSYTVTTLGKWMQNPFRKDTDTEEEEYKKILSGLEIGTEATRAGILEKAVKKKYIKLKKNTYKLGERGAFLVESCKGLGIDMSKEKTAEMGKMLKAVNKGEKTISDVLQITRAEITDIIHADKNVEKDPGSRHEVLGKCPRCGADFINGKFGPYCEGKCGFIMKKFRGKKLTKTQVKKLLHFEKVKLTGVSKKDGSGRYDIVIIPTSEMSSFDYNGKTYYGMKFDMEFPKDKTGGQK